MISPPLAHTYNSPKHSPTTHNTDIMTNVDRLVNIDGYFLGRTIRKYRFAAVSVMVCKEIKASETPRMPWNLHIVSPHDQLTVIKAVIVNGMHNVAMKISDMARFTMYAFVRVRSR